MMIVLLNPGSICFNRRGFEYWVPLTENPMLWIIHDDDDDDDDGDGDGDDDDDDEGDDDDDDVKYWVELRCI